MTAWHMNPLAYEQITDVSSSVGLTAANYDGTSFKARKALIQATGQSVRWRDDGTAPTASVGMVLAAGDSLVYEGDLSAIRFIQTTNSAVLNVSYYSG